MVKSAIRAKEGNVMVQRQTAIKSNVYNTLYFYTHKDLALRYACEVAQTMQIFFISDHSVPSHTM